MITMSMGSVGTTRRPRAQGACILMICLCQTTCSSAVMPPIPHVLEVLAGDDQTGTVNTLLADRVVVKVATSDYEPVPGIEVRFTTQDGGMFEPATVVSDAAGEARTFWRLGASAGTQLAQATVASTPGISAELSASATAGPVASVRVSPDTLRTLAGLEHQLQASVHDAFGNEVGDAAVQWSSSNTAVVTVAATGSIIGRSAGTAFVIATAGEVSDSAYVVVAQHLGGDGG